MPRIGITIPIKLLSSIDATALAFGYSRSEFVRHALRKIIVKEIDEYPIPHPMAFQPKTQTGTSGTPQMATRDENLRTTLDGYRRRPEVEHGLGRIF